VPIVAVFSYLVSLLAITVWPVAVAFVFLVTWPFDRNRALAGRLLRLCGAFISRTFPFWHVRVLGHWPEGTGAYVVVSNHESYLDILLISNIPHEMKWVAKRELFRIPWLGWAFALVGDMAIERGNPGSAAVLMGKARRYLDRGMSVMFFPEGTRGKDGRLLPFKTGAFKLAVEAGVPVLPMAVSGTAQGMPKGSLWVKPSHLAVRILNPFPTQGLTEADVPKLRDEVRHAIERARAAGAYRSPEHRSS
jgi:1-acyl-sn-glycerol-3-phosphate acyltransferase